MTRPLISHDELLRTVSYDPQTGVVRRLVYDHAHRSNEGSVLGTPSDEGYLRASINGKFYHLHRLVWFYSTGAWPIGVIDHVNRDRADNRISNLRDVTHPQNCMNIAPRKGNSSGFRGVRVKASGRFAARLRIGGHFTHLGTFDTARAAFDAYLAAVAIHHGAFVADEIKREFLQEPADYVSKSFQVNPLLSLPQRDRTGEHDQHRSGSKSAPAGHPHE